MTLKQGLHFCGPELIEFNPSLYLKLRYAYMYGFVQVQVQIYLHMHLPILSLAP